MSSMDDSRFKDVGSLLSAFFDEEKLQRGGRYAEFFANWKYIVGDRLAAHSRIADVDKGVLIVEAEHPGWIQLLQFRQHDILAGVSSRFPELALRSVVFRLAKGGVGSGAAGGGAGAAAPHRPGPFGPGGRDLIAAELAAERGAQGGTELGAARQADSASERADADAEPERHEEPSLPKSLGDIADPALRALLSDLKRAVEKGREGESRDGGEPS
ncbi:MAG: DUF721 domain-containing protein [Spirochaetaceae bacterium]|nr:DUF721 domain-containing protein [Spirochaetaceae bacterium]